MNFIEGDFWLILAQIEAIYHPRPFKIYPNEARALVKVEIIADSLPEPDETFYWDVFNPVGATFGEGVVQLTAVRNIVNDDGWYWG